MEVHLLNKSLKKTHKGENRVEKSQRNYSRKFPRTFSSFRHEFPGWKIPVPRTMNKNKPTPRHIIMKLKKTFDKGKILTSSGGHIYLLDQESEWYQTSLLEDSGVCLQNSNGELFPTKSFTKIINNM